MREYLPLVLHPVPLHPARTLLAPAFLPVPPLPGDDEISTNCKRRSGLRRSSNKGRPAGFVTIKQYPTLNLILPSNPPLGGGGRRAGLVANEGKSPSADPEPRSRTVFRRSFEGLRV